MNETNVKWRKSNEGNQIHNFYCVCENFPDSILLWFRFRNSAWNSLKSTALNLLGPRTYLRILAEVDNAAEEVEETLEALEWLEQVDEGVRRQLLVVLRGNLNAHLKVGRFFTSKVKNCKKKVMVTSRLDAYFLSSRKFHLYFKLNYLGYSRRKGDWRYWYLKILPDVGLQHSLEALHWILHRKGSEKVHQPVWKQKMRRLENRSSSDAEAKNCASHLITGNWICINGHCCFVLK